LLVAYDAALRSGQLAKAAALAQGRTDGLTELNLVYSIAGLAAAREE
jgi:hypothetical protein